MELGQKTDFFDGTIVVTDFQTAGRGQRGTSWQSEAGKNLMMSLLIDSSFLDLGTHFELSMCTAISIYETLKDFGIKDVSVKWPNDVYIKNKKVGGVLIENSIRNKTFRCSVIGFGLNLSQEVFENPRATSLLNEGFEVSRETFIENFSSFFEKKLLKIKAGESLKLVYYDILMGFEKEREFIHKETVFKGIIKGVTDFGELIIESELSKKKFDIKEVSFVFE